MIAIILNISIHLNKDIIENTVVFQKISSMIAEFSGIFNILLFVGIIARVKLKKKKIILLLLLIFRSNLANLKFLKFLLILS